MIRAALVSMVLGVCAAAEIAAARPASADPIPLDTPARLVFDGAAGAQSADDARSRPPEAVGGYANGCLFGGRRLAADGDGWQAMRPARDRHYGHPILLDFIARLAFAAQAIGWPGVLVGDMSQAIGGPMRSGHRSHQSGIDVDIWLRPAPERRFSVAERNSVGSPTVLAADRVSLGARWTPEHHALLRAAAQDPAVARIFVNAAIKKRMCQDAIAAGEVTDYLHKIRPWWGHSSHFHVRLHCPLSSGACEPQDPPPPGDGCDELDWWFTDEALNPAPPTTPRPVLRLGDLPARCQALVTDR